MSDTEPRRCWKCGNPMPDHTPGQPNEAWCWRCIEENKRAMSNDTLRQWIPIIVIGAALLLLAL